MGQHSLKEVLAISAHTEKGTPLVSGHAKEDGTFMKFEARAKR